MAKAKKETIKVAAPKTKKPTKAELDRLENLRKKLMAGTPGLNSNF